MCHNEQHVGDAVTEQRRQKSPLRVSHKGSIEGIFIISSQVSQRNWVFLF